MKTNVDYKLIAQLLISQSGFLDQKFQRLQNFVDNRLELYSAKIKQNAFVMQELYRLQHRGPILLQDLNDMNRDLQYLISKLKSVGVKLDSDTLYSMQQIDQRRVMSTRTIIAMACKSIGQELPFKFKHNKTETT